MILSWIAAAIALVGLAYAIDARRKMRQLLQERDKQQND